MELTYAREMKTWLSGGVIKLDPHAEDWGLYSVGIRFHWPGHLAVIEQLVQEFSLQFFSDVIPNRRPIEQ